MGEKVADKTVAIEDFSGVKAIWIQANKTTKWLCICFVDLFLHIVATMYLNIQDQVSSEVFGAEKKLLSWWLTQASSWSATCN